MVRRGRRGADTVIEEIHCEKERFEWIENGFCQTYCEVNGRKARVLDYAPGQALQPHEHDCDERFIIGGGAVTLYSWPNGRDAPNECTRLVAGDIIEVPCGMPHALYADKELGIQFHEVRGHAVSRVPWNGQTNRRGDKTNTTPFVHERVESEIVRARY